MIIPKSILISIRRMKSFILFVAYLVLIGGCSVRQFGNLTNLSNPSITLKTSKGIYVRAILGAGDILVADARELQPDVVFTLEWVDKPGSQIKLLSQKGYYVHAGCCNRIVDAVLKKGTEGTSEVFTVEWVHHRKGKIRLNLRDGYYLRKRKERNCCIERPRNIGTATGSGCVHTKIVRL